MTQHNMHFSHMAIRHLAFAGLHRRAPADGNGKALGVCPPRASRGVTYIICTTPRSGSWLLSEGLASTSLAGNPREWFNVIEERRYRAQWRMEHSTDLSFEQYLRLATEESTTRNGISGIKLHYYQ